MKPTTPPAPALVRFKEGGVLGEYPFTTTTNLLKQIWDNLIEFDYHFTEISITLPDGRRGVVTEYEMHVCFAKGHVSAEWLATVIFTTERKEVAV